MQEDEKLLENKMFLRGIENNTLPKIYLKKKTIDN